MKYELYDVKKFIKKYIKYMIICYYEEFQQQLLFFLPSFYLGF